MDHFVVLIAQGSESMSYGWQFAKMLGVMLIVIGAALVSLKFLLPLMLKMRRRSHSSIEVLDYQCLEQRKSVYLIKVKDKEIAVAMSESGVAKLAEWPSIDKQTEN